MQKKVFILDSEDERSEEEIERRAFSPRTRMSITGIRPADLSGSEIESSIEDEDNEQALNSSNEYQSANDTEDNVENGNSYVESSAQEKSEETENVVSKGLDESKSANESSGMYIAFI